MFYHRIVLVFSVFSLDGTIALSATPPPTPPPGAAAEAAAAAPPMEVDLEVDCAIIGGGPAGLATAIALSKSCPASTRIAIFEKDDYAPKGASIQISGDGWKSVKGIDSLAASAAAAEKRTNGESKPVSLVKRLEETSVPVTSVEIKPWVVSKNDSDTTDSVSLGSKLKKLISKGMSKVMLIVFGKLKVPLTRVHLWHDVRIALRDHALHVYNDDDCQTDGTASFLNMNCTLEHIRPLLEEKNKSDPMDVDTEEKDPFRFELTLLQQTKTETETRRQKIKTKYLFACDGSKSQTHNLLPLEPPILLSEQKSVWRGMSPTLNANGKATFYRGTETDTSLGKSALLFPAGKGGGTAWSVISGYSTDAEYDGSRSCSVDEARDRVLTVIESMRGINPSSDDGNSDDYKIIQKAIMDSPFVIENKLSVRDFTQPWASAYNGLVYIGDSAHPVRPTGEGIALALEDAHVLGRVIGGDSESLGPTVETLRRYEDERYEVVKKISERVKAQSDNFYKEEKEAVDNTKM